MNYTLRELYSSNRLQLALRDLANEIDFDYIGAEPLVVGILKGSLLFMADLIRQLKVQVDIDFIELASYRGSDSTGQVQIKKGLDSSRVGGRDVILLEDIVDTGLSLTCAINYIRNLGARSTKVCVLLNKQCLRAHPVDVDYIGLDVPDIFVVGYGLDYNEQHRQMPNLCSVEFIEEKDDSTLQTIS